MQAGSGARWLVIITVLLIIYSYADWPGSGYIGIANKTFWDYLELLIVPAALAFGVYWLNRTQEERQREADNFQQELQREYNQMQQDRGIEFVTQQTQDSALRAYLEQMSQLMLAEGLTFSEPGAQGPTNNVIALARAWTLTVLPALDARRKRSVLQFLYESGLLEKGSTIVDLTGGDLSQADLQGLNLSNANLHNANLSRADLGFANLRGANLSEANLQSTDLIATDLSGAILDGAILSSAKLSSANLSDANLSGAYLVNAVYLSDANLSGANLSDADLSGAQGWPEDKLSEARTLRGATMPDGQILRGDEVPDGPTFEVWLTDREPRGEVGENE